MNGWRETTLGEACELYQPKTISSAELIDGGAYPVYGANGVIGRFDKFNHADSQLLITCRGATCGSVNISQPNSWINGNAMVVKPRDTSVELNYLKHLFKGGLDLTTVITGAAQPQITRQSLAPLKVSFPSSIEQRRIAAILDQADALRTKRREALVQLDSLTKSIFIEMFGDPMTNPMGWNCKPFSEIGKVVTGNTPSREVPDYYGNAIEWIKSDNINTPHYYLTKATEGLSNSGKAVGRTVPPFSILVTCIAGSPECIGNAAMTDREVAFNQQINAFVPISVDPHFIYAQILIGKKLIQEASTNGMKGMVSKSRFEKIMLMEPDLALQKKFAIRAQAIEALKASHVVSLTKLDALFDSLQHRAFQGEL